MGISDYASSWISEARVLYNLAVKPVKGESHKARLESFYGHQAGDYDAFRKRLLTGREELMNDVAARAAGKGGIWVDMGGGTGANLEMMGDEAVMSFAKVYVVDLCGPLLDVTRKRCEEHGWHNVEVVEADATTWEPEEGFGQIDVITFSYSLTMIPDWCVHAVSTAGLAHTRTAAHTHARPRGHVRERGPCHVPAVAAPHLRCRRLHYPQVRRRRPRHLPIVRGRPARRGRLLRGAQAPAARDGGELVAAAHLLAGVVRDGRRAPQPRPPALSAEQV